MPTYADVAKPTTSYTGVSKPSGLKVTDVDYIFQDGQLFTFQDGIQQIFSSSLTDIFIDIPKPI